MQKTKVSINIEAKTEIKPWCYVCGRTVDKVVEVWLPCSYCATEVKVRMCLDCAKVLRDALDKAIQEAEA